MTNNQTAEINRQAWNKIVQSGRNIHASKGGREELLFEKFIKLLPLESSVLDLGCGNGIPFGQMLSNKGFYVTGVDISDEMVKEYRRNVNKSVCIREAMTEINFNEEFDGVLSSYSMLCLPIDDFRTVASKVVKALKKDGLFLLFLNEGNSNEGCIQEVQGQQMYSTGMSETEIRNIFEPLGMEILETVRETEITEEYGKEDSIYFLMKRKPL